MSDLKYADVPADPGVGQRFKEQNKKEVDVAKEEETRIAGLADDAIKKIKKELLSNYETLDERIEAIKDVYAKERKARREELDAIMHEESAKENFDHPCFAEDALIKAELERLRALYKDLKIVRNNEENILSKTRASDRAVGLVKRAKSKEAVSTGFPKLDKALAGGLTANRLYTIGAISSLGKTSFCLQVADQIAFSGIPVVFFSLEMGADELMEKSVSRYTYMMNGYSNVGGIPSSMNEIESKDISRKKLENQLEAEKAYRADATCLYIVEGDDKYTTADIRNYLDEHCFFFSRPPIVFVDYLQILKTPERTVNTKDKVDQVLTELKHISRDYGTSVVAISSFNRDNYNNTVSFSSFKETGNIEYGSDVVIGLQYLGMKENSKDEDNTGKSLANIREIQDEAIEKASKGEAVPIEVVILKQRNYSKGTAQLLFTPMFNYFSEPDKKLEASVKKTSGGKKFEQPITEEMVKKFDEVFEEAKSNGKDYATITNMANCMAMVNVNAKMIIRIVKEKLSDRYEIKSTHVKRKPIERVADEDNAFKEETITQADEEEYKRLKDSDPDGEEPSTNEDLDSILSIFDDDD